MDPAAPLSDPAAADRDLAFAKEVARLRQEHVFGTGGRLHDLFDYLAGRGCDAEPANQAEIAAAVFGQSEPENDDATVRVYVHRLRKRLENHYAALAQPHRARLEIPAGIYALRFAGQPAGEDERSAATADFPPRATKHSARWWPAAGILLLLAGAAAGWALANRSAMPANAFWEPLLESERPLLIVLGDYYIFGEIDPVRPEEGRLIRDFRVNSPSDLDRMQDLLPERFAAAQDVGLNYLPFSAAYGLQAIVPLVGARGKEVSVIAASQLEPDMLNRADIVYIGLMSGMGLLEDLTFRSSRFTLGESYDELIDDESGRLFVSGEARTLPTQAYYRDYAYLARYRAPGGALVVILAGSRDTGLRALSAIASRADLPPDLIGASAQGGAFETLYEITGQQGADLAEQLVISRALAETAP